MPLTIVNQDAPPAGYVARCGSKLVAVTALTSSPWVNTFTLFDPASNTSQVYEMSALASATVFGFGTADPAGDSAWFAGRRGSVTTLVRIFPDASYDVWTTPGSSSGVRFASAGPTHVYVGKINSSSDGLIFDRAMGMWAAVSNAAIPRIVPQWYGSHWYTGYDDMPQRVSTSGAVTNLTSIPGGSYVFGMDDAPGVHGSVLVLRFGRRWDMSTESQLPTVSLPAGWRTGDATQVAGCDASQVWVASPTAAFSSVTNAIYGHGGPTTATMMDGEAFAPYPTR